MNWTLVTGPLIGAIIGYFTNYLAVKMLFRPRSEIKFLGKRLPFTPGVIPKGKPRLAKSIGRTVAETLLTGDDIKRHMLSEEVKGAVSKKIMETAKLGIKDGLIEITEMDEKTYEEKKVIFCSLASWQIYDAVATMPIKEKVAESMMNEIKKKLEELKEDGMMGSMIAMMINDDLIKSIIEPVSNQIYKHIDKHGMEYIRPALEKKVSDAENLSGVDVLSSLGIEPEEFEDSVKKLYGRVVESNIDSVLEHLDLAALIEEKINAMDVIQLEDMVLSVMKKELNIIVRLGALIGLIIGALNIFI